LVDTSNQDFMCCRHPASESVHGKVRNNTHGGTVAW
jgi:hypothetical protein